MPPSRVRHATSGRLAAVLLILLTFVAACGRGDRSDRASDGSPTPAPTPTPLRVATGGEPGDEGEGATPTPTARPGLRPVSTPVADDPADTLRAFFDAVEAEDYDAQLAMSIGPVHDLTRVRDIIQQENARRGATTTNEVTVEEPPSVEERDEEGARLAVKANIRSTVTGERGTLPSDAAVEGPVALRRIDGTWRLADLVYSGRPLGPEHFPLDANQVREGIRLEIQSVLSYKRITSALIRFVNEAGGGVPLTIRHAVLTAADGQEHEPRQVGVDSRDTPTVFIGFAYAPERPQALTVEVEREDTGATWTYDVRF